MGTVIVMREDAVKVFFLGVEVYAFGLYVRAGSGAGPCGAGPAHAQEKWRDGTAALTGVLAMGLGFAVSACFFGLMDDSWAGSCPVGRAARPYRRLFHDRGAAGAVHGRHPGRQAHEKAAARLLDLLAPALLLFVACERLGEATLRVSASAAP
jgi:hypothetical protein